MIKVWLMGESPAPLWGLDGHTRLARQVKSLGGMTLVSTWEALEGADHVLLVRADHVFELRALSSLLGQHGVLMADGRPAAAHVPIADAQVARTQLETGDGPLLRLTVEDLNAYAVELRKSEPPLVAQVTPARQDALESRLYGGAYKGVTDFVTKWWWPRPARVGVKVAAVMGLTPNMVTLTGFVLMLVACWAFAEGHYVLGLACGWFMTYLDTVDGKLARVTVQSSRFGHWLDHGMDIVHPPFWYWCWGLSLVDYAGPFGLDVNQMVIAVFAGYIGGRLVEATFHSLGPIGLFAWRPFDAYFRLFTARRNPCLVLLTVGGLLGSPALGFDLVVGWTVLSTAILLLRLVYAAAVRLSGGPLTSWLADPASRTRYPRAHATFSATRSAYS